LLVGAEDGMGYNDAVRKGGPSHTMKLWPGPRAVKSMRLFAAPGRRSVPNARTAREEKKL